VRTLAVILMLTNVGPWTVMAGKQAGRRCDLWHYLALYCNVCGLLISGTRSAGLFSSNALNLHSRDPRFETRLRNWTS